MSTNAAETRCGPAFRNTRPVVRFNPVACDSLMVGMMSSSAIRAPSTDTDHDDYEPCEECLAVIIDTLESYTDQATASEDEFGETPLETEYLQYTMLDEEEVYD